MEQQPSTECGPVLPQGVAPFSVQGMQILFDHALEQETSSVFFGGIARANEGTISYQKKIFSEHQVSQAAEALLKTGKEVNFLEMLPLLKDLPKADMNFIAACACHYLTVSAFVTFAQSGTAPEMILTCQDSGDYEFGQQFFCEDWTFMEYRDHVSSIYGSDAPYA